MADNVAELAQRAVAARNAMKEARSTYGTESAKYTQAKEAAAAAQAAYEAARQAAQRANQSTDQSNN